MTTDTEVTRRRSMSSQFDLEYISLPISNEENKQLEEDVQLKKSEISTLQQQISEHNDRIQVLTEHLKNVQQELNLTQALYEARKKDVETEKHLIQVAGREEGRLKDGYRQLKSEQEKLSELMNAYENNLFKTNTELEKIRKQMNWEKQTLEAWLEESARRDEDASTIAKYARSDEAKIKELLLKSEELNEAFVKAKHSLTIESMETVTAQIELDSTAQAFRQAHHERESLISQWEQIIEQMKRRDQDMDRTATELARLKAELKVLEGSVNERKQFLDEEKNNNKEMEKRVSNAEGLSTKTHNEYQEKEKNKQQLKDELETLKYSVDRAAADLESMRAQSHRMTREIKEKTNRLDTLHHQLIIMQEEHKKAIQKTLSAEDRAHKMDQLLAQEEASVQQLEKELTIKREKKFKQTQQLQEVKKKKQNVEAEIQSAKVALRNLISKQRKVDDETLKQQELLYIQDFQLQQLDHKLNRLEGERTEEEKAVLNKKMKELEGDWESQSQSETLLSNQLKRLQDDLRRATRHIETKQKEKNTLLGKIDELNLHIDSTQRELRKMTAAKQDLMVDENIIKLEVKRLRDALFSCSDDVVGLEKDKQQLMTVMSERKKEIMVHKEMLKIQIKTNESERLTFSTELHDRIAKIDRLRKRYEILTMSMNPPEGEEEHSQTYYVIKAAQEREELQREGDDLDAKIRKAEKEIQALENTLALINSKNNKFRKSLQTFDPSGDDSLELEALEGQCKASVDKYRHKRKQLRQIESDIQSLNNTLALVTREHDNSIDSLENTKEMLAQSAKEHEDIKVKLERANKQSVKLTKELRSRKSTTDKTDVEEDIELRELRDLNASVLQQLGTIAATDTELTDTIHLLLSQVGLPPPPSPTGSKASSLPTSARSSTSQLSSSSVSSRQSTPRQSLQYKSIDISLTGQATSPRDERATPQDGFSPRSSTASSGSKGSRRHSKPPSPLASPHSSVGSASRPPSSLDLTIRPS